MNNLSLKEKAIAAMLGVIAMYVAAVVMWFAYSEAEWKRADKMYTRAKDKYAQECKLIGEKRKWTDAYDEEKAQMPTFEAGKSTDTTWLKTIDEISKKHNGYIQSRQSGKEIEAGDVRELNIEVKNWEGSLESLVKMMHELENTKAGMFDMGMLSVKPSNKKGYLKGSFTLTCAYMREE